VPPIMALGSPAVERLLAVMRLPACLGGPFWVLFQHSVSHVRAAEMKLKQNNLVDLRLKFCFNFISVSFYMCERLYLLIDYFNFFPPLMQFLHSKRPAER